MYKLWFGFINQPTCDGNLKTKAFENRVSFYSGD